MDKYRTLSVPLANRVVGATSAAITRTGNAAGESALGDVIGDAQLAATAGANVGGAVAALMNAGGIRADLDLRLGARTGSCSTCSRSATAS